MSGETFRIGSRGFRSLGLSTIEQDLFFWGRAREAGLDALNMGEHEPAEDFAHRVLDRLVSNEHVLILVGAVVVPEELADEDWSPEVARETAEYLRTIRDPQSKQVFRRLVASLLAGFFENGLGSFAASRSSSTRDQTVTRDRRRIIRDRGATGRTWFGRLREAITRRLSASRAGRSAKRAMPG